MKKIALISFYVGNFPWYFSYFLHSCRYNPSIAFFIYTDNDVSTLRTPDNVRVIPFTLLEFNDRISDILEYKIEIKDGYKLCDFKPTFGLVFYEAISDYDFWGYCDIDVLWGSIRTFMTDELLSTYDVISARHDYLTGCFALYRNNEFCRNLFRQSKDYLKVFTTPDNLFFDETNFAFEDFGSGKYFRLIETDIESMTHVTMRLAEEKLIKAYFDFQIIEGITGEITWDSGVLLYKKKFEALLFHLIRYKKIYSEPYRDNLLFRKRLVVEKDGITHGR